jgi:hypothetical protein
LIKIGEQNEIGYREKRRGREAAGYATVSALISLH